MSWIGALFWLLPRRLRSSWVLLAITGVGVLAAVTLLSVGAIYSRALAEGGLRHSLASVDPVSLNTHIIAQNRPLGPADYVNLRAAVEEIAQTRLGFMLRDVQRFGRVQPNLSLVNEPFSPSRALGAPAGRPFFLTDFEQHSRLIEGRWPSAEPQDDHGRLALEVVVGEKTASVMFWEVGSEAVILPYRTDYIEQVKITVVGLAEPIDPDEEYWMGFPSYFSPQEAGDVILMPLYVPESLFFDGLGARYPTLVGDYGWYLYLDTDVLNADLVQPTRDAVSGLETDINKRLPRSLILTRLENSRDTGLLASYQRALTRARVPIYLFISMVVVVILYFLALVTGLLAHTRSEEAALLRSRGAGMFQVGGVITLGEALLVLLTTAIGPFLALLIFRTLLLPTINPLGGRDGLPLGLAPDMFLMAGVGGLMSLAVLLASNANLTRLKLLDFLRERARPPSVPFLQRYYVDLLAIVVLALVWWQVERRGGFLEQSLATRTGDAELDLSLLVAPALALLAAAFLVLRALPLAVRVCAWVARRLASAWVSFALSRVARDPLPYGSLTVIVMLAAALGIFGASFQSTLSRSQREQALYRVGGDMVVNVVAPTGDTAARLNQMVVSLPAVRAFSPVKRESVSLLDALPGSSATLLAIDPATFPEVAWFREDFSPPGKSLSELLTPLRRGQSRLPDLSGNLASGVPIPESAERVGIWVNTDALTDSIVNQTLQLWLRMADADGSHFNLDLGSIEVAGVGRGVPSVTEAAQQPERSYLQEDEHISPGSGWTYLEAPVPQDKTWLDLPFSVVSVYLVGKSLYRMPPGEIYLDDITVKPVPSGSPGSPGSSDTADGLIIEDFEEQGRWVVLPHDGGTADAIRVSRQAGRNGGNGLAYAWEDPILQAPRGLLIPPGAFPLAAIGGPGLPAGRAIRVDIGSQLVPVVIQDKADYFPTITTDKRPFLVMALKSFEDYSKRIPRGIPLPPQEYWIALEEGANRQQIVESVREATSVSATIRDRAALVDRAERNPLAGGGWNGLTLMGLAALTIVVTLALGAHAVVAIRTGRVELTVARALGFSLGQLIGVLFLERLLVAAVGLVSGAVIGYYLSRWTLGFLGQTTGGRTVIPPMVLTVQEWLIGLVILNLLVAALLAIFLAAVAVGRLRPSDILRTGE